jgi:D-serine deaminase-like pyridoxal phosphate-dependent protein
MSETWYLPPPGTLKSQIPTPALLIDQEVLEENITLIAQFFKNYIVKLRPHFKTHKSPLLARKQIEAGAIGMTCAKLGEADVLVDAGIESILVANEIIDPVKIGRVAQLALKSQLIVAVDQADNLRMLSQATQKTGSVIHVVVEIDVGMKRCGVQPGEAALSLARLASQLPGLHFSGVLGYEGQAVLISDREKRSRAARQAMQLLVETANLIRQAGLPVEIVSAGGTGTYDLTGIFPGITEVEAGSYLFMDTKYRQLGLPFRCALTLLATVISIPTPSQAIIDAGMKVLSTDNGLPEIITPGGVTLITLHEEHGILEVDPTRTQLQVGERVELIPSHVCTTVNLHDRYYALRDDRLEAIWPITGRGKSQ